MAKKIIEGSKVDSLGKVNNSGIFAVYWETGNGYTMSHCPNIIDTPREVKVQIAQGLIDELGINIRLEPPRETA